MNPKLSLKAHLAALPTTTIGIAHGIRTIVLKNLFPAIFTFKSRDSSVPRIIRNETEHTVKISVNLIDNINLGSLKIVIKFPSPMNFAPGPLSNLISKKLS